MMSFAVMAVLVKLVSVVLCRAVPVEIARFDELIESETDGSVVPVALRHTLNPAVPESTVMSKAVIVHEYGTTRYRAIVLPAVNAEPPPSKVAPKDRGTWTEALVFNCPMVKSTSYVPAEPFVAVTIPMICPLVGIAAPASWHAPADVEDICT